MLLQFLTHKMAKIIRRKYKTRLRKHSPFNTPDTITLIKRSSGYCSALGNTSGLRFKYRKIPLKVPLGETDSLRNLGYPTTGTENYGGPVVTKKRTTLYCRYKGWLHQGIRQESRKLTLGI